jgi:hypothetical protein
MYEGLLWFDADPKTSLGDKVAGAAKRYQKKYGRKPNLCYVNPLMLPGGNEPAEYEGVRLIPRSNVLMHHFWIGVEETAEVTAGPQEAPGERETTAEGAYVQ